MEKLFKIGKSGILGGFGLGVAMVSFIYSITNTTAAITLLCLAAMPFTALLAFVFLKEQISLNVWISILIATVGIAIMAFGNTGQNSLIGLIFWNNIFYRIFYFFSNLKMEKRDT